MRILIFICCGSGFHFSPWCGCGSGSRSQLAKKTQNHWKSAKKVSYSKHFGLPAANWCGSESGSGSSLSLWCGSGFLFDADPGYQNDADPCGSGCTTLLNPVWRIRDVYPGSDFFPSRIPDPNCLHPGSRILKEFKYFNPHKVKKMVSKLLKNMIRVVHLGSRIRMLTFSHPGSRIQGSKSTQSRIRIRNTG